MAQKGVSPNPISKPTPQTPMTAKQESIPPPREKVISWNAIYMMVHFEAVAANAGTDSGTDSEV